MNKKDNENITLEEYENKFSYKKNKSNLNIEFNRVAFIFFVFLVISTIYSIQLLHLGSLKLNNEKKKSMFHKKNYRADIIDRNGNYIAKTISTIDVGIKPKEVIDKKHLLLMLNYIYENRNFSKIEKRLNENKFFYLEKNINPKRYEELMLLGDKSIKSEESLIRLYPQDNLFSHVIGQIDNDNNGISGIEKSFDIELKKIKESLKLTLDTDIQFLIRKELVKFQEIFKSKGSAAILMDVNNGEIFSMVSLPDFNLNKRATIKDVNYINRITKGTYELGSVFKTFTIAAGINEEIIEPDTEFLNSKKFIRCGSRHKIREYDEDMPSDLTVEQILIRSGNVGSVRIIKKIGVEKHKSFLKTIGILDKIDFDIEEVGKPQKINWNEGCKLETISFGHGITTTILQLAKGYSIISNGGYDIKPTIIKKKIDKKHKRVKILKNDVSKKISPILRKIVSTKEGTAKQANVAGYHVGGKTGTAQQSIDKKYSKTKINTFASIFPTENPKYALVVMIESPKLASEYVYKYRNKEGSYTGTPYNTAGWTSVEVAGKIIEKIGPILATKYMEN